MGKPTPEEKPAPVDRGALSVEVRVALLAALVAVAWLVTGSSPQLRPIAIVGAVALGFMIDPGRGVRRARENFEAIIVALILALVIRHYTLEAFEIPTGSMAPGLNGVHVDACCPNCGTVDSVGIAIDPQTNAPNRLQFTRGFLYEGPCPTCATPIDDAVTADGADVLCRRCDTHRPGEPGRYQPAVYTSQMVRCHHCALRYRWFFEASDLLPGHKILVNKASYSVSEPERWDVIVFKFNRQRNYIKRLVGMPGERIEVVNGDIEIDGEIERKPDRVQEDLWFPVHDSRLVERGIVEGPWSASDPASFTRDPEDSSIHAFNSLDGAAHLRYVRPIVNDYSYNGAKYDFPQGSAIRDFRARVDLRVNAIDRERAPAFMIDLRNGEVVYRLELPLDGAAGRVVRLPRRLADLPSLPDEEQLAPGGPLDGWSIFATLPEGSGLDTRRRHELEFALADRQLRVRIDGDLLLELPTDIRDRERGAGGPRAEEAVRFGSITGNDITLRAHHCGGRMERIRIDRDIHYTNDLSSQYKYAVRGPYEIGEGRYFAMGDNSPSSLDSRAWGSLSGQNLLGEGFAIFWPALPWRFEVDWIR
jgi:signal peptidase I